MRSGRCWSSRASSSRSSTSRPILPASSSTRRISSAASAVGFCLAGTARRSRGSRSAGCAARARRRRRTGASGPRSGGPRLGRGSGGERGLDLREHPVERQRPGGPPRCAGRRPGRGGRGRRRRWPRPCARSRPADAGSAGRSTTPSDGEHEQHAAAAEQFDEDEPAERCPDLLQVRGDHDSRPPLSQVCSDPPLAVAADRPRRVEVGSRRGRQAAASAARRRRGRRTPASSCPPGGFTSRSCRTRSTAILSLVLSPRSALLLVVLRACSRHALARSWIWLSTRSIR